MFTIFVNYPSWYTQKNIITSRDIKYYKFVRCLSRGSSRYPLSDVDQSCQNTDYWNNIWYWNEVWIKAGHKYFIYEYYPDIYVWYLFIRFIPFWHYIYRWFFCVYAYISRLKIFSSSKSFSLLWYFSISSFTNIFHLLSLLFIRYLPFVQCNFPQWLVKVLDHTKDINTSG